MAILIFNLFKIVFFKLPPKLLTKETRIDDLVMWYVQPSYYLRIITTHILVLLFIIIITIIILSLQLYVLLSTIILCYIPELS